jgi:hypothetical protein
MLLTQAIGNWENAKSAAPLQPFADEVVEFFNSLSAKLTAERGFSDVVTFGFWCRKAALLKEKAKYDDLNLRFGKGIIFHSTPSNVAVNFAFSFAAGLLAGNANIVRLPAKDFEQTAIICGAIEKLRGDKYKRLTPYVSMLKYPPDKKLNDLFSSLADVRVVWGGDATIAEMRESPLKPRASEVAFADRHSIAVINADAYLESGDKMKIAQDFYNDTYFTDQNACTSPKIIFWLGKRKEEAKALFWDLARSLAKSKYELSPVQAVGKLTAFYLCAAKKDAALAGDSDNYVKRVTVKSFDEDIINFKYHSGFFLERDIDKLGDILPVCGERCQTMTYFGLSKQQLAEFFLETRPKGVDRAVPIGKSMDFALIWDGYDLIRQLSRRATIL